jgi:hypothetical protein
MQSVLTFRDMFFEKYFQPLASKNLSLLTSVAFATFRDVFPEKIFSPPGIASCSDTGISGIVFIFNGLKNE